MPSFAIAGETCCPMEQSASLKQEDGPPSDQSLDGPPCLCRLPMNTGPAVAKRRYAGEQLTVGQVQLPLVMIVTPKLLPLPLGRAVITWPDPSQLALMFQVALIRSGDGTFIVTTQLLVPDTATFRL